MAKKDGDQLVAETQRVYAEYDAARAAWEAAKDDPLVRARFNRAQQGLREHRQYVREIGEAVGNRDSFVRSVDGELELPTLLPQEA